MNSIVNRDVFPRVNPYPHVPAAVDEESPAGAVDDVEPGQHPGGGWISGPSNPPPHTGPHTGGADQ